MLQIAVNRNFSVFSIIWLSIQKSIKEATSRTFYEDNSPVIHCQKRSLLSLGRSRGAIEQTQIQTKFINHCQCYFTVHIKSSSVPMHLLVSEYLIEIYKTTYYFTRNHRNYIWYNYAFDMLGIFISLAIIILLELFSRFKTNAEIKLRHSYQFFRFFFRIR